MLDLLLELRKVAKDRRDRSCDDHPDTEVQLKNEGSFAAYDDMLEEIESVISENFNDTDWVEPEEDPDLEDELYE